MFEQRTSGASALRLRSSPVWALGPVAVNHPRFEAVRGLEAVLLWGQRLQALARRCGQAGEADNLAYFLCTPDNIKKIPWLICERVNNQLTGAVLLFEYRGPFSGSGVFMTADATGRRNVFAPLGKREILAVAAARYLAARGAHIVHLAVNRTHTDQDLPAFALEAHRQGGPALFTALMSSKSAEISGRFSGSWTLREQEMRVYLPLAATYDKTLAAIGKRTRGNLRYYRRRSEADLGCQFVANVQIGRDELIAFNRECQYAVPDELVGMRYAALQMVAGGFLRGIRDREGRWLSLVAGRRQNGFAEIDWQMNRADQPAYSIGLVMRAYVIEHEVSLRSTRLYFEGGTPQAISHSFVTECVAELTILRASSGARIFRQAMNWFVPKRNYLAQVLTDPELAWQHC